MKKQPFVSIIIPVHNSVQHLHDCLRSILDNSYREYEVIVVDDASTDNSAEIAMSLGITAIRLSRQKGPAAARNKGANEAKGDILLFVDSDVLIKNDTVSRVVEDFLNQPQVAAVFGSYDDNPADKGFFSQYKNLYHHYVHQHGCSEATTFWAGCGAIRKDVFLELDGFDQAQYKAPSIEDIELGYRMTQRGLRIFLDKQLQVKHLKRWDLLGLLRADIFYRAVPWTRLTLESGAIANTLNLKRSQRISVALVGLSILAVLLSAVKTSFFFLAITSLLAVCLINLDLYRFLINKKGALFAAAGMVLHFLYFFYSGIAFLSVWVCHKIGFRLSGRAEQA